MALTKARETITQVTATGTSTVIDIADSYSSEAYIKHVNGTGTITAGAQVQVEVRPDGGTDYFNLGGALLFGTTASATETRVVLLPDSAGDVRFSYTAPTGSTGHTLDAEVAQTTGI